MDGEPPIATATPAIANKKEMLDKLRNFANLKMLQQKKQQIDRQKTSIAKIRQTSS
jgi:hypothetical protein